MEITARSQREPWFLKFGHLMPYKVHEVLLVASAYDAFALDEDGRLDEQLVKAFSALSLPSPPRLVQVSSAKTAIQIIEERHFDLVITVARLEDTNATEVSKKVKEKYPFIPVILLTFDEADLKHFPGGVPPSTIDQVFLWTGDARLLFAAIKLMEDIRNTEHDIAMARVKVILFVEDSLRRYSTSLAMLYSELLVQSQSLIAEGVNAHHQQIRRRARPRIFLATNYEQAEALYERFKKHMQAIISDVRFPRNGIQDAEAGYRFLSGIRKKDPDIPLLLQSAEPECEQQARALDAWYVNKNSPTMSAQIRTFLKETLGFGDFIFRLPNRTIVGSARDLYEMRQVLQTVASESILFHAERNHFSTWLNARGMFSVASQVRRKKVAEFKDVEALRYYLLNLLKEGLSEDQAGVVADYSDRKGEPERQFVRLGRGSLGGKGRGLAFVHAYVHQHSLQSRFPQLNIRIPKTVAIATQEFDRFLDENVIRRDELGGMTEAQILQRFLEGRLGDTLVRHLATIIRHLKGPLAVRSSSLLEDSRFQPFAGIYSTFMLPNNHPDAHMRFIELRQAIKAVYASTFSVNARAYILATPHTVEDEKMGVVIQELAGHTYGERFYPLISGVAQSHNHYPASGQRAEDGVALIALGLGQTVVSGLSALRLSPASPRVLPQFSSARDMLQFSQSKFYALNVGQATLDFRQDCESSLKRYELSDAEADGTLNLVGSVYSPEDDVIRDNMKLPGPRVITFNNILKWQQIPLASALKELLQIFRHGMGSDVEFEFAVDVGRHDGKQRRPSLMPGDPTDPSTFPTLYLLQLRPMATEDYQQETLDFDDVPPEQFFCKTSRALGHGHITNVRDVIYVKRIELDGSRTSAIAAQVGEHNARLKQDGVPYLLIGPGRWGTADPALGIPVEWAQIAGARVIVETRFNNRMIEPSQGTHFFHNVTMLRIGYLTVCELAKGGGSSEFLDFDWLEAQPALYETEAVRHVRLEQPLFICLDGKNGRATILKEAINDERDEFDVDNGLL